MTFSSIPRPHLPTQPRILAYTEAESGVPDKELGHTIFISIIIVFISLLELDLFGRGTKNNKHCEGSCEQLSLNLILMLKSC